MNQYFKNYTTTGKSMLKKHFDDNYQQQKNTCNSCMEIAIKIVTLSHQHSDGMCSGWRHYPGHIPSLYLNRIFPDYYPFKINAV